MVHFLIEPECFPPMFGETDWRTPGDFLTEMVCSTYGLHLPTEYIVLEEKFIQTVGIIVTDLWSEWMEYKFLYVQDPIEEEFDKTKEEFYKTKDDFLFASMGLNKAEIEGKISHGPAKPAEFLLCFQLYLRGLCRICVVDKQSGIVLSDGDEGFCFFVSVPDDYDIHGQIGGYGVQILPWHDIYDEE